MYIPYIISWETILQLKCSSRCRICKDCFKIKKIRSWLLGAWLLLVLSSISVDNKCESLIIRKNYYLNSQNREEGLYLFLMLLPHAETQFTSFVVEKQEDANVYNWYNNVFFLAMGQLSHCYPHIAAHYITLLWPGATYWDNWFQRHQSLVW